MSGNPDELRIAAAEEAIGGAFRLQDIPGVGDQTIRDLRANGFRNPNDIRNATVAELQRVPGIGEQRAESIIRDAGGNPRQNARSTGSVSAAGVRVPVGDFRVELGDQDRAAARNEGRGINRTAEAVAADKGHRAPITTDFDEWQANKSRLDFPGVDTPTDDPEVMEKDRLFISPDDLIGDMRDTFF